LFSYCDIVYDLIIEASACVHNIYYAVAMLYYTLIIQPELIDVVVGWWTWSEGPRAGSLRALLDSRAVKCCWYFKTNVLSSHIYWCRPTCGL